MVIGGDAADKSDLLHEENTREETIATSSDEQATSLLTTMNQPAVWKRC